MKAKKLILLLIILPNTIFSQDYCPFDFEDGIWSAYFYAAGGADYILLAQYNDYAVGDTLVNDSLLCYKLRRTGTDCGPAPTNTCSYPENWIPYTVELGLICEQDKRVYYDGNLLYDFNVEIGDTIHHWWYIEDYWFPAYTPMITSIDSSAGLIPRYEYFESGADLTCYSDENCAPCLLNCGGTDGTLVPGSLCDDGHLNTVNDVYQPDCSCAGTPCNEAFILEFPANH